VLFSFSAKFARHSRVGRPLPLPSFGGARVLLLWSQSATRRAVTSYFKLGLAEWKFSRRGGVVNL